MKITVNDKNEVIGFVNTGGLRNSLDVDDNNAVSYTHLRAHETGAYL
ncbi:DUF2977 domain-containing protein, partial [Staphylococcus aureus]